MFNYSTGPVELSERARAGIADAPSSSHMADAQVLIAETLGHVQGALGLGDEFVTLFLPGSIRQALDAVTRVTVRPNARVTATVSGYWGSFMSDLAERRGAVVTRVDPFVGTSSNQADILLTVHVETEFGEILPIAPLLQNAHKGGALTVVDVACSTPIDPIDPQHCDVLILGSHKTLGGPPGLAVIAVRSALLTAGDKRLARDWSFDAYLADAQWKSEFRADRKPTPSPSPPLVTYPIQIVAGLRAALVERTERHLAPQDHDRAATWLRDALERRGFRPYRGRGSPSHAVVRADVPAGIETESLRRALAERGFYVIGNIGRSASGSIRIGTMSAPQIDQANLGALVNTIDASLRSLGSTNPLHAVPR